MRRAPFITMSLRGNILRGRAGRKVDQEELNAKLQQIEEQAQLTLSEFPKTLTKERQRMIIALVRYIRTELELSPPRAAEALDLDPERTIDKARH